MLPNLPPGTSLSTSSGGQGFSAKPGELFHTVAMVPAVSSALMSCFKLRPDRFWSLVTLQSFFTCF